MYQIQQDKLKYFEKEIDNPNRKITYKFTLNDEQLEANQIMDNIVLTTDTGLDQYGVGCALVTQLQISLKSDVLIIPNDKIAIQVGLDIYNEVTQQWETIYVPMGTYYVDNIEEKSMRKSIKAYDGMYKLNKGYFPSAKHTTTQAIVDDIASANDYKVNGLENVSIDNEQLEGKSCLEMLTLVASATGTNVRVSRSGDTIEFIEPVNGGLVFDEGDFLSPTIDDTTTYDITKLRVIYGEKVADDEGTVTDEGYYEVGEGTDSQTLAISNVLLKGQETQAQAILEKAGKLNGYKRFDVKMPSMADFRLEPMDIVTYTKGEKEYIVPIIYMQMILSYKGVTIETQSPTTPPTKSEFSFKGTLTQKVENIYTQIIQAQEIIANKVTVEELEATIAKIELLKAKVAEIDNLIADSILSEIIQSGSISSDLLNIKDAFIKDAMIDSLTASKISSGVINTNNVSIQSDDGNMLIQGNLLQFKDANDVVRIQIGKDTKGNYTFVLYDSTGKGVLINQDGIQSSNALGDGLIVDANINDNANISGGKLDISSVFEEMNADGASTLNASKVYLNDKEQTLEVSFKQMTTKQDELEETMSSAITDFEISQGQISQLIQNTTITTTEGTTTLKDDYNHTKSKVDSHSVTIGSMESKLDAQSGEIQSMNNKVSELEQNIDSINLSVSQVKVTTDELKQQAQDFQDNIDSLNDKIDNLDLTLDDAIKDGIISEAEAKAIKQQLTLLDREKAELDAQYEQLYNNTYLK